jgi:hypothetical protein
MLMLMVIVLLPLYRANIVTLVARLRYRELVFVDIVVLIYSVFLKNISLRIVIIV